MSLPKLASICVLAVCVVVPAAANAAPQKKPAKTHADSQPRVRERVRAHVRSRAVVHAPEPTTAELARAERLAVAEKKATLAAEKAALALKALKKEAEETDLVPVVAMRTSKVGKKLPVLPLVNASIVTNEPKPETKADAKPGSPSKARAQIIESVEVLAKTEKSGEKHIDKALIERMQSTVEHFTKKKRAPKILLVAGYRPDSKGSHHATGRAVDFRLEGIDNDSLVSFCKTLKDTGCGFYPNSSFVHMDVREKGTGHPTWIDASAPGESPRYVASWPEPVNAEAPAKADKAEGVNVEETPKSDKAENKHDVEDTHPSSPSEMVRIEKGSLKTDKSEKADKDDAADSTMEAPASLKAPLKEEK